MTFSLFLAGLLGAATIVGVAAWTLSGRRAQSPARQLSTTGEVDSHRSMTKKERLKEFNANTKVLKDLCTNDPKSFNESMKVVRDLIANLQLQVSNDASNSSVLVANPDVVVGGRQKRHEGSIPYALNSFILSFLVMGFSITTVLLSSLSLFAGGIV